MEVLPELRLFNDGGITMSEIIYGIDMNNSTSKYVPKKQYCKQTGEMCELAGDFGYCKITACIKKNCGADMRGEEDD